MRKTTFRGKLSHSKEWIEGNLINANNGQPYIIPSNIFEPDGHHLIINSDNPFWVDAETVGQYWRTVNEIDIYDGDIFTINGKYPKVVKYDETHACFCIGNIEQLEFQDTFDIWQTPDPKWWEERALMIEIIGNIHDNPELLLK